jgi:hypothetical protein
MDRERERERERRYQRFMSEMEREGGRRGGTERGRYIEVKWKTKACANCVIKNEKYGSSCWLSPSLNLFSPSPPPCIRTNYLHFSPSRPI